MSERVDNAGDGNGDMSERAIDAAGETGIADVASDGAGEGEVTEPATDDGGDDGNEEVSDRLSVSSAPAFPFNRAFFFSFRLFAFSVRSF